MRKKTTIFLIEDDLDTSDLIVDFFTTKQYIVKSFSTAETALAEFVIDPNACDVLITDFMLPQMSGVDLIKQLQVLGSKAPIILMTGNKSSELAAEATRAGAYDFITKPIRFTQLQVSVERAVYFSKMRSENEILKTAIATKEGSDIEGLIGKSPKFLQVLDLVKRVASSQSSILITGESGTGKEVIARAIHQIGKGEKAPFVAINCSAIPENLLESELFGHAKGSFTGAVDKKVGLFEEAQGGTLFLDEIGDMSLALQAKVLRAIQERKIKRVGENQTRAVEIRIISATHKNFKKEIANKSFREDLFYRLNVIPIHIPPLRERSEDILLLADFFLKKYSALNRIANCAFTNEAKASLLKNYWPGNVRELENTIERAVVLCFDGKISDSEVSQGAFGSDEASGKCSIDQDGFHLPPFPIVPLDEVVCRYLAFVLELNHGAKDQTAKDLGINRKTLYLRLRDSRYPLQKH